jgi:regulator of sigma E protease
MSVILFIIILAVLIFVHELGHFLAAKKFGIKVSEFGIGFPPRLWSKKKGETTYVVNAVPFGGYVKILGEDPTEEAVAPEDQARSLVNKPKLVQTAVLAGGVAFNIIFAWILISLGFMLGLPTPASEGQKVINPKLVVTTLSVNSPAEKAGIRPGDVISQVYTEENTLNDISPQSVSNFIEAHGNEEITFVHNRGEETLTTMVVPEEGIVAGRKAVGISMDMIGTLKLPIHKALWSGAETTVRLIGAIAVGIVTFLGQAFTGSASLSQVTGPVGIVGLVGDVSQLGFIYLLSFTAFISVNLAVVNLLPFPALDGGRILFVIIEAIKGSPIKPKVANMLNGVGFAILILLMIVVTLHDIVKLF